MIRRLLFLFCIAAVVAVVFRTFVVEGIYIASASMEPTLSVGSHFFLQKLGYRFHPPRRGDIVVFSLPEMRAHDMVKRVIGLPDERIEIKDKSVFINGVLYNEPYVKHTRPGEALEDDSVPEMVVPHNSYFVMGDNRDESNDSRDWKDSRTGEHIYFVTARQIKGALILPF
ncbi:MAG: signal peptidase I [Endomicrobiales bacterium]|jgi:signal peptidase I